jgi:hypothetical protein
VPQSISNSIMLRKANQACAQNYRAPQFDSTSRIRMEWPCLRSLSDGKWELTWSWFENSEARRSPSAFFFPPQEVTELSCLPQSLQDEGFFLCWTRKEAYVKARGEGLNIPLKRFHVTLTPGKPECLHATEDSNWTLRSLRPDPQYVGALVAEGRGWKLRRWSCRSDGP